MKFLTQDYPTAHNNRMNSDNKKSLARDFHVPSHTKKFTFFAVSWPRIDTLPQNLIHKVTSPLHTIAEIAISEKKLAHDRISLSWFAL